MMLNDNIVVTVRLRHVLNVINGVVLKETKKKRLFCPYKLPGEKSGGGLISRMVQGIERETVRHLEM